MNVPDPVQDRLLKLRLRLAASRAAGVSDLIGWDDYPLTAEARERLSGDADHSNTRHNTKRGSHFDCVYDDVMDEVVGRAEERGVEADDVRSVYSALVSSDARVVSHRSLVESTGLKYHNARQAAAVLSDIGDVHECYDPDWNLQWARCDDFVREKCEDRRISLYRYFEMYDELKEFQNKTIGWYVRRNRRQQQPFNLVDLKAEYVERLQEEYFPDKDVGEEWSAHIAARYLRTAQDVIVRSYDLTY